MTKASLFCLFSCWAIIARSQDQPENRPYFTFKVGPSFLFTGTKTGLMQVRFPYSVKPVGGTYSDSSFVSNPFAPLKNSQAAIDFSLEIGNKHHFFVLDGGGYTSADNGSFVSFGYGRNIYISVFQSHDTRIMGDDNMVIKPSLHIGYNNFNRTLATFNNQNKYINIGSYTSGPTFSESQIDVNNLFTTTTTTYTTQTLNIGYLQRSCVLSAEVSLGSNHYKHSFHWEILAGAYWSATEAIGIRYFQEGSSQTQNGSSFYRVGTNAAITTFNGNPITKTPFLFSGFKIGLNVGLSARKL